MKGVCVCYGKLNCGWRSIEHFDEITRQPRRNSRFWSFCICLHFRLSQCEDYFISRKVCFIKPVWAVSFEKNESEKKVHFGCKRYFRGQNRIKFLIWFTYVKRTSSNSTIWGPVIFPRKKIVSLDDHKMLVIFILSKNWTHSYLKIIPMKSQQSQLIQKYCPIHVVTFTLISNLVTDYIQKRRGESGLFISK